MNPSAVFHRKGSDEDQHASNVCQSVRMLGLAAARGVAQSWRARPLATSGPKLVSSQAGQLIRWTPDLSLAERPMWEASRGVHFQSIMGFIFGD
jgi:hypothetical protein